MEHRHTPILSARDASSLIDKRSHLPKKVVLSLKGHITALSEKIRVKNDVLFLIEIDHCVYIIVKDFHLDWHTQLFPSEIIVLYELRLTTIEKGVSEPRPILAVWKSSRFEKAAHSQHIECTQLKEWLSCMKLEHLFNQEIFAYDSPNEEETLLSYSGIVTNLSETYDGIYELDNNVRFVTWLNPSIQRDLCLPFGCKVRLFNAHKIEMTTNKTTFVCCLHTFLESDVEPVVKRNMAIAVESIKKQKLIYTLEDMKLTISKYKLNYKEVEVLLQWRDNLKEKKSWKEMEQFIYYLTKSFCQEKQPGHCVSSLDEFIQHARFCPFHSLKSSACRIGCQMTLAELHQLQYIDDEENSSVQWRFQRKSWENKEILSGHIIVNEDGQTEFQDQTSKMPVVLVQRWNDHNISQTISGDRTNSDQCDKKNCLTDQASYQNSLSNHKGFKATEKLSFPFITPLIIGKMFYVNKFSLILEQFNMMETNHDRNREATVRYLMFSLEDCVMLENVSVSEGNEMIHRPDENRSPTDQKFVIENDDYISCLIYVSNKQQRHYSEKHGKHFQLYGRMLNPTLLVKNINDRDTCEKLHRGVYTDSLPKLHQHTEANLNNASKEGYHKSYYLVEDVKKRPQDTTDTVMGSIAKKQKHGVVGVEVNSGEEKSILTLQPTLIQSVPFTMCFHKQNICLFPFLQPGHFYLITTSTKDGNNKGTFKPEFLNEKLASVVYKYKTRASIEAPEDMEIKEIFFNLMDDVKATFDVEDILPIISVAKALSDQFDNSLVSFTAIVVRRETQNSTFTASYNPSYSNFRHVRLDLCDLVTYLHHNREGQIRDSVPLYFDSSMILPLLGLVPGCMLDVCSVERKVSKNGNVYCRFIAVSSINVRSFVPPQLCLRSENQFPSGSYNFAQHPKEYIRMIWERNLEDWSRLSRIWHIECHVCVVFSLKLQLFCRKCNGQFLMDKCQSRGCDNSSFEVATNIVTLVEDGTGQAVIKMRKSNLVRKFLTLNDKQWDDAISLLQTMGQVYICKQNNQSVSNELEAFLYDLVNSSLVVRPLKILIQVFKNSHSINSLDKMKQEEFQLKDVRHGRFPIKVLHQPYLYLDCVDLEKMKEHLRGQIFESEEDIELAMKQSIRYLDEVIYIISLHLIIWHQRMKKGINTNNLKL